MSIYKSQGKWRIITIILVRNFNITLLETDRSSNQELVRCRRPHNTVNKLDSTDVCVCVDRENLLLTDRKYTFFLSVFAMKYL